MEEKEEEKRRKAQTNSGGEMDGWSSLWAQVCCQTDLLATQDTDASVAAIYAYYFVLLLAGSFLGLHFTSALCMCVCVVIFLLL